MSEQPPTPPAGWYPTPSGSQRYWDGSAWLELPAPDETDGPSASIEVPGINTSVQSPKTRRRLSRRQKVIGLAVIVGLIIGGAGAGISAKVSADAAEADRVAAVAEAAAVRKAEEKKAAELALAAEEEERAARAESVVGIERSIKKMARDHMKDGLIDGPILRVSCSPVNGGSTDDLTETTTVFECFVSTKDHKDGTSTGYYYNSTMNWSTGAYTYGLGRS